MRSPTADVAAIARARFNFLNADEGERLPTPGEGGTATTDGTMKKSGEMYVEIGGRRGMQNRGANLAPRIKGETGTRGAVSAFLGRPTARPTTSFPPPPSLAPSTTFLREKGKIGETSESCLINCVTPRESSSRNSRRFGGCSMGGRGRMPTFLRRETNGCDPSGLQMKSRGSISGGIGWICFNASLKKIERMRVIYIRVLDV